MDKLKGMGSYDNYKPKGKAGDNKKAMEKVNAPLERKDIPKHKQEGEAKA